MLHFRDRGQGNTTRWICSCGSTLRWRVVYCLSHSTHIEDKHVFASHVHLHTTSSVAYGGGDLLSDDTMSSVLLFFGPRAARQRASWALLLFGLFLPLFSASVRAAAATPLTSCAAPLRPGKREVIFITGGTGMIGSQLVKHALDSCVFGSDKEVVVLARWRSNLRNLKGYVHRLRLVYGDVTDPFHMINVFREVRPDYVFHFAAQAINGVSFQSASLSLHVNVQGTLNVLEAIKSLQSSGELSTDLRVLVAGSSAEYGGAAIEWEGVPIPETAMLKPFTPYGVSKVAQENLALMYASTYGIKAMVARIFIQMAEGGTDQLSLQNFAKQIAEIESRAEREDAGSRSSRSSSGKCSAAASEQSAAGSTGGISSSCGGGSMSNNYTLLHGDLSTSRDVTDVADSAPVFLELCKRGVPGEAYNLGSGVGYTIRDMLQVLLRYAKVPITLQYDPTRRRGADEKTLLADNRKIRELTGWTPNPNITQTAHNILQHWREEVAMRNGD